MEFGYIERSVQYVDKLPEDPNVWTVVIAGVVLIIVFLLVRDVICWFNKTNKLIRQNNKIIALLDDIKRNTTK
jgi:O-antigen/teichoic acid export membrane protein